jgi:ABC-2 type transport system permease protein
MRSFLAMVLANMKMTVRNRGALFWNLAFPAIFIVMFGAVFGNTAIEQFNVGIAGADSLLRQAVVGAMESTDAFRVHEGSVESQLTELESDDRTVVLVFPEEGSGAPVELYAAESGGPTQQIAIGATRSLVIEVAGGATGVIIEQRQVSTLDANFIDWFVPGILGLSLMNSGIIGISTAFVSFREKGILRRIKVTPFALWKFLLARIVAALVMALITSAILITMGWMLYDLTVRGSPLVILASLLISAGAMLAIGYAIAAVARNTEAAASYANMVTVPMMFLSGVFFSVSAMPGWMQPIINIMPLKYAVEALREPMLYGRGVEAIWREWAVLLAIFAVFLAFAIRFFRWDATTK